MKRFTALLLSLVLFLSCVSFAQAEAVDSDSFLGKSVSFEFTADTGVNSPLVTDYEQIPPLQYILAKEWDPAGNGNTRKVDMKVITPPIGNERDYLNNILSTGDYSDLMSLQMVSTTATEMYENGQALDITDYVKQYMPNYLAYFERHPELKGHETCMVDGEPRYLCLYGLAEKRMPAWGGMVYRRDWIVKYGRNPVTGDAFTGAWSEDGTNWTDDVVFPSGNPDPMTISDWEWMLDIFQTALTELGIDDGYALGISASGMIGVYDFESAFGDVSTWYIDPQTGDAAFGATSDSYRAYLECLRTWYEKGWINPYFYEFPNDMFFMVDAGSVYSGKVGAWYGMNNQMGSSMDFSGGDESNPLNGIVVFGAPNPINDVYGDESMQGITPFYYYAMGLIGAQVVVTDKAKDKDLPALFTFLDYFYSPEGSILATYGLNAEQTQELEAINADAYGICQEVGLSNGAYTIVDGKYRREDVYFTSEDASGIAVPLRFPRLEDESNMLYEYPEYYKHSLDLWGMYPVDSLIGNEIMAQLTPAESDIKAALDAEYSTFTAQAIPEFITGERDIRSDADWEAFCNDVNAFKPQEFTNALNRILQGK